jgi:hypothetical protein
MMKNEMTPSQKALEACFVLHKQLLTDACYAGYDGDFEAFERLYDEVYIIARDEVSGSASIDKIVDTFHDYQFEQMNGEREIGWYL